MDTWDVRRIIKNSKRLWVLNSKENSDQRLVDFMEKYPDFISGIDALSLPEVITIINLLISICTKQVIIIIFLDFVRAKFKDYYKRKQSAFIKIILKKYPHKCKKYSNKIPEWNSEFLQYIIIKRKINKNDMLTNYLGKLLEEEADENSFHTHYVFYRELTNICKILIEHGAVINKKGVMSFKFVGTQVHWGLPFFSEDIRFYDTKKLFDHYLYTLSCSTMYPYIQELNDLYIFTHRSKFIGKRIRGFNKKNKPSSVEIAWVNLPSPLFSKILTYLY